MSKNAFFRGKNVDSLGKISSGKKNFPAEKNPAEENEPSIDWSRTGLAILRTVAPLSFRIVACVRVVMLSLLGTIQLIIGHQEERTFEFSDPAAEWVDMEIY